MKQVGWRGEETIIPYHFNRIPGALIPSSPPQICSKIVDRSLAYWSKYQVSKLQRFFSYLFSIEAQRRVAKAFVIDQAVACQYSSPVDDIRFSKSRIFNYIGQ